MRCSKCGSVEVEKIASKNDPQIWRCKSCDNLMIENNSVLEDYRSVNDEVEDQTSFEMLIDYLRNFPETYKQWIKHPLSIAATITLGFFLLLVLIISSNTNKNTTVDSKEVSYTSSSSSAVSSLVSSEVIPEVVKVSESDITEVDYVYYLSHPDKMVTGKHYRVSGRIVDLYWGNKMIVLKDSDGKELRASMQKGCDLSALSENDYVSLVGTYVTNADDWVYFSDSYIEESGEAAEQTYQRLKAKGDKLRAADAKAEKEKAKKAKKDYIASCKTYKYKDIARNPDKYYGKRAKFKGKVVQVIEGYFDTTLRVDVTKGKYGIYTDTMYVVYTPQSTTENRILEDDIITIYGELAGIETYETVMGAKVSIPRIDAEYITINSK
jgi:hypothetical protein